MTFYNWYDINRLTSAQSFVLGRKSPFSFELHLLRGGETNERIIADGRGVDRGVDHPRNIIDGHSLNDCLDGLSINRSFIPLRLD